MVTLWAELDALEREHHLDFLRQPDLGFAWAAYRWAEGDELDDVLTEVDLAAGDFVRWMKQLLDVAGQVADAAGDSPLRGHRPRASSGRCGAAWSPTPGWPRTDDRSGLAWVARPASAGARLRTRAPSLCSSTARRRPEAQHLVERPGAGPAPPGASSSSTQDRGAVAAYVGPGQQPARVPPRAPRTRVSRSTDGRVARQLDGQACGVRPRPRRPRTARRARPGCPPASTSTVTSQRADRPRIA